MKKRSIFLTIFFFSIFVRTLKYANMIRISNTSFFRFCWKNGKLDWPKCARTCVPEGFFSCCLRRKLSDEAAVVTSGFFSRSSRSRLRRQTTGKKPSGIQGIVPASFAVQCVQRKTHLSKYYKETCARNFSCSYPFCTRHPHGKNFDRVGGTCLENFACL